MIDLCDELLGAVALRQHRFDWLLGDPGKNGRQVPLPVDAFYPGLGLVVEYQERQHFEAVALFDKPGTLTVSGVPRGEQRRIYDRRREEEIPKQGLKLVVIRYDQLACKGKRLVRDVRADRQVLRGLLGA